MSRHGLLIFYIISKIDLLSNLDYRTAVEILVGESSEYSNKYLNRRAVIEVAK